MAPENSELPKLKLGTLVFYHTHDYKGKAVGFVSAPPLSEGKQLVVESEGNKLDPPGDLLALDSRLVSPRNCRYSPLGAAIYKYRPYQILWDSLPEYEWVKEYQGDPPMKVHVLRKIEKGEKV